MGKLLITPLVGEVERSKGKEEWTFSSNTISKAFYASNTAPLSSPRRLRPDFSHKGRGERREEGKENFHELDPP